MSTYRNTYRDMVYTKYYLEEACKLVDEGKVNKIYEKDKIHSYSILQNFEADNIFQYKYVFIELLSIATINKNNDANIDKLFKNLMENINYLSK